MEILSLIFMDCSNVVEVDNSTLKILIYSLSDVIPIRELSITSHLIITDFYISQSIYCYPLDTPKLIYSYLSQNQLGENSQL